MSGNARRSDVDAAISALLPLSIFQSQFIHQALNIVRAKSSLLDPRQIPQSEPPSRMVLSLLQLLKYQPKWHRSLWSWDPPRAGRRVQFDSLVSHLFVQYELPRFMPGVWLRRDPLEHDVFFHLAKGLGIRQFQTPIRCTRAMVPHFMTAPADLTVIQALRWAQVRSLGGGKELARTVVESRLAERQADEPFWESAIRLLTSGTVGLQESVQMIDFLNAQRFVRARTAYGIDLDRPVQPELSLQGHDLMWLRRHMANWRDEVTIDVAIPRSSNGDWEPTTIAGYHQSTDDGAWTITEITSPRQLAAEGSIMHHCVYTYRLRCRRRHTSIWSLQHCSTNRNARVLTIEVNPRSLSVLQVKGKCNQAPTAEQMALVNDWARKAGLTVRV